MIATRKVAISMPDPLYREVERLRKTSGESRSRFFQRAVVKLLTEQKRQEAVERYVEGYRRMPETVDEIRAAESMTPYGLEQEPWE